MRFLGFNKDDWRRAVFELLIVFLGVLIALLVDESNSKRLDLRLEQQYLERLERDVEADLKSLEGVLGTLQAKTEALSWLQAQSAASLADVDAVRDLAPRLVRAHSVGFGVLKGTSTTFQDLRSTGNLALVRDPQLRSRIVEYYELWSFNRTRIDARRSGFPALVYKVLPPGAYDSDVFFDAPSPQADFELDLELVTEEILSSSGRLELQGELNYARFFGGVAHSLLAQARELLHVLETR